MFSFTLVALALMSAALAAGDLVAIHREGHTLTATNLPLTEDSNSSPGSKNSSLNTGVAKWLTRAVISISKREYHGISQPEETYRGYLICFLRARSSMVEHKLREIGVDRSNRSGLATSGDTRIGISACLWTGGDSVNSRFGSRGSSRLPLRTKIAA